MKDFTLKWGSWIITCLMILLLIYTNKLKTNQIDQIIQASRDAVVAFAKECN